MLTWPFGVNITTCYFVTISSEHKGILGIQSLLFLEQRLWSSKFLSHHGESQHWETQSRRACWEGLCYAQWLDCEPPYLEVHLVYATSQCQMSSNHTIKGPVIIINVSHHVVITKSESHQGTSHYIQVKLENIRNKIYKNDRFIEKMGKKMNLTQHW